MVSERRRRPLWFFSSLHAVRTRVSMITSVRRRLARPIDFRAPVENNNARQLARDGFGEKSSYFRGDWGGGVTGRKEPQNEFSTNDICRGARGTLVPTTTARRDSKSSYRREIDL